MHTRRYSAGMSLLELLVAMAVGALLLMLLNEVLNSVQTGWHRAEVSAVASNDELAGVAFLRSSVVAALPPDPLNPNTRFIGTTDQIEFTTIPPDADAFLGVVKMHLYLQSDSKGKKLVMIMQPLSKPSLQISTVLPNTRSILSGLESVNFSFSTLDHDQLKKISSWSDADKLPKLVNINLSFSNKNAEPINLVIAPRRSISGRCRFDLISINCRD